MIARISRGGGLRGLVRYALEGRKGGPDKRAVVVGGTCDGASAAAIARELGATRRLRPDVARPAWHCALSLAPGEHLSDERWGELSARFMTRMGFGDRTLYAVVRHGDTEHEHVHIIASRIDLDGHLFLGRWEAKQAHRLTNELAREYGLREVELARPAPKRRLKQPEIEMALRQGHPPPRRVLQGLIDSALADRPTPREFVERLRGAGVGIGVSASRDGMRMNGFSFVWNNIAFRASQLGEKYKWAGLSKAIDYEQNRDAEYLAALRCRAEGPELDRSPRPGGAGPGGDAREPGANPDGLGGGKSPVGGTRRPGRRDAGEARACHRPGRVGHEPDHPGAGGRPTPDVRSLGAGGLDREPADAGVPGRADPPAVPAPVSGPPDLGGRRGVPGTVHSPAGVRPRAGDAAGRRQDALTGGEAESPRI